MYDKYVVDEHKVGTTNFTHNYSGLLFKSIAVGTIVGKDDFVSTYHAPANVFDQNFPIFENIIKSIRFVDASSSQTNTLEQQQQQPTLPQQSMQNDTIIVSNSTRPLTFHTYQNHESVSSF